jgi:hypothetical protein
MYSPFVRSNAIEGPGEFLYSLSINPPPAPKGYEAQKGVRLQSQSIPKSEVVMERIQFDSGKFKELLVYVASKCSDFPRFGSTKLNKILYYSDFLAFGYSRKPITGATYQHLKWGPAPRQFLPVVQELILNKEAIVEVRGWLKKQKRLVPLRKPNLELFSGTEIALVDSVIDSLRDHTAEEASDVSHMEAGWKCVAEGEDIPYTTVFVSHDSPTADDIRWAQEFAAEHGWVDAKG